MLGLLLAPVAVLMTMGEIEPPDVSVDFDQYAWIQSLDSEQQAEIAQMETDGQTIAEVMKSLGMQEQTIKAQLLYFSCFNDAELTDYLAYGNLFANATDDAALIEGIVRGSEQNLSRAMFKIAVELGALTHMLVAMNDVDDATLYKLRLMCSDEVNRINGIINFEKAVRYQRSE